MPKTKLLLGFLISVILVIPLVYKLLRPGFFPIYDDMQVIRVNQMDKCIKDGQIPCRWVPDLGYGYGYPLYQYYAPLPYYLLEVTHLSGLSFVDSVKAGFILSMVLSGMFFYLFLKSFLPKSAALFGTILYLYAPFKAADLYVRGAMGELWGFVALPLVLWGFESLIRKKTKLSMALFAACLAIYLTSHNLTVLMSLPVVFSWIVLRLIRQKAGKETLVKLAISGLIGLAVSSFYWLPLVIERNLVYLETLKQGYFNYLAHFISLKQIFISTKWGYGPSIEGALDDAFLGLGPIASLFGSLGILFGIISKKKEIKIVSVFFGLLFIASAFLSHGRSAGIWANLGFLQFLQFPWRFMLIGVFTTSVLGGIFVSTLKEKTSWILCVILFIGTLALYGNYYQPRGWLDISDGEKLSGELLERQLTASIYDYLPKVAKYAPKAKAPDSLIVQSGQAEILNYERGSNWYGARVEAGKDGASLVIPAYNFPVWEVRVNNQKVVSQGVGELGLVGFNVSAGKSEISAKLLKTWPRKVGDTLSLLAILGLLSLSTYEFFIRKNKKN